MVTVEIPLEDLVEGHWPVLGHAASSRKSPTMAAALCCKWPVCRQVYYHVDERHVDSQGSPLERLGRMS